MIRTINDVTVANEGLHLSECDALHDSLLAHFAHFAPYSSPITELSTLKLSVNSTLAGVVPVVQLNRRSPAALLVPSAARWIVRCLGPLAKKTTALIDTSFLAYDHASPFRIPFATIPQTLADRTIAELQSHRSLDSIMVIEPLSNHYIAGRSDFDSFLGLPMMHAKPGDCTSLEAYVGRMTKKRRRNYQASRQAYASAGARCERFAQLPTHLTDGVIQCLSASAHRSAYHVPYQDVMTAHEAFATQTQRWIFAMVGDKVIGFATYTIHQGTLFQTHGGLDYELSYPAQAYHNLMYALIEDAIANQCHTVSFGPLNNETKRRIADVEVPMVASLWNRKPIDRLFARKLLLPKFRIKRGEFPPNSMATPLSVTGPAAESSDAS